MALFRAKRQQISPTAPGAAGRFPSDMPAWLEAMARFEWAPQRNPMPEIRVDKMYFMAQSDRDGFLRDLAKLTTSAGGWVALGGKYLVTDILPIETDTPDFKVIVLAGLLFLRDSGVPLNRLSPNDRTLWQRLRPDEAWLVWREPPPDVLTPLLPGEVRKVAEVLRADGHSNDILVRQDAPDKFVAAVEGAYNESDLRRMSNDWHSAASLHELYIRIGESSQTPPHWAAAELTPYFPLPTPRI
jgi:hypothetical protein